MYTINSPQNKVKASTKIKSFLIGLFTKKEAVNNESISSIKIFDALTQLVVVKDSLGCYQMVNQSFCDLTGLTETAIIGKNDIDLRLFLNPDQIMATDKSVFTSGQKKHIPLEPFTDKYGSLYWFSSDKIPLRNDQNEIDEILIISTDISKRIELNQQLTKSELRYKSIFENNYSGIIVVDKQLNIINKNKAFNKLTKQEHASLGSDDLKLYISKSDKRDVLDLMAGLIGRNYEYFDLQLELSSIDNTKKITTCYVRGLYNETNSFTEAVVTFQDITETLKNQIALEESEHRFKITFENATEALLLLDFDSKKYIDSNKNAVELFGYSKEEMLNLKLGELSPINQSTGGSSNNLSSNHMERAMKGEHVTYEWTIKRKDNKMVPCEVRLLKLPYKTGNIVRTSVIDITERKKAERLLNLEKQKLEETNNRLTGLNSTLENQTKQLQEFAYISSHNLRSPAGNIRALLDFYQNDPTKENLVLVMEKLDIVSVDLLETINDLANVVKIKNEITLDITRISLDKLIDKIKISLSQQIIEKKAEIIIDLNNISHVKASKTFMESIILNLLSNALKYSKDDVAPIIRISAHQDEDMLVLQISDNGLGLDLKKHGAKVFGLRKTFHRNKDSRGIGLFITKAQIEAINGTISISSTPNVGTTFTIHLPKKIIDS